MRFAKRTLLGLGLRRSRQPSADRENQKMRQAVAAPARAAPVTVFGLAAAYNTDDGTEGSLFQPHPDGGSCQTLPGRPFQRRSRWPTHRHVAGTEKLDTLRTRTSRTTHTSPSTSPAPSVPLIVSGAYFSTSNSAVASFPMQVKRANSLPGCRDKKLETLRTRPCKTPQTSPFMV